MDLDSKGELGIICKEWAEQDGGTGWIAPRHIDWDKLPEPEENEFGPVSP